MMTFLRERMRAKFDRHVPSGTLLYDRWELARSIGAGEQSSIYDECLILGDVRLGSQCWVGPFTLLDGSGGGLEIGDWTSIGSGCHVYSHHTIDRVLSAGRLPTFHAATKIGKCCFVAPHSIIGPGTVLGDHSFVTAGSYVEGTFPAFSILAGSPARRVGRIEIIDGKVVRHFDTTAPTA